MALASVLRLRKELIRVVDATVVPRDAVVRLEQPRLSLVTKYVALAIDDEAEGAGAEAAAGPPPDDGTALQASQVDAVPRELPAAEEGAPAEPEVVAPPEVHANGAPAPADATFVERSPGPPAQAAPPPQYAAPPAPATNGADAQPTAARQDVAPAPVRHVPVVEEPVAPRVVVEPAPVPPAPPIPPAPRREAEPVPDDEPRQAPAAAAKSPTYFEALSQHRLLLGLPIAICVLLALMVVLGTPKTYESGASLWFNYGATDTSPNDQANNPAIVPPSTLEQQMLTELLTTRSFRVKIGHQGPLAKYLATHSDHGWSPLAVLSALRAKPSLDYRIMSALGPKHVLMTVAGPHVLAVSFDGPTPAVAAGTLRALIAEYSRERVDMLQTRASTALASYEDQLTAAQEGIAVARTKVQAYEAGHPSSTARTDAVLRAYLQSEKAASDAVLQAATNVNGAKLQASTPVNDPSAYRVLDNPTLPTGPKSGKKKALMAIFAGLFLGCLISFLGFVALRRFGHPREALTRTRRRADPVREAEVVSIARPTEAAAKPAQRQPLREQVAARRRAPRPPKATTAENASPVAAENGDGEPGQIAERALAQGRALQGRVVGVWDEGDGKQTRPVWTIRQAKANGARLRPGTRVWMVDDPRRQAVIRDIRPKDDGTVVCELEITHRKLAEKGATGKMRIAPADKRWVGSEVTFVHGSPVSNGARRPSRRGRPAG